MPKFTVNYDALHTTITKKAYRLADVKDQLESIAFGVVRFKDADKAAQLWEVQSSDDGDYIVALYGDEDLEVKTANDWSVKFVKSAGQLQVSYKGDPLVCLASQKLGIPPTELNEAEVYLPSKLAESKKLVKALLNELSPTAKINAYKKYPELL
jgi:hypothetical protein